jgi:hypothetical protein
MKSRKPLVLGVLCIGLVAWIVLPSFIQYFAQRELLRYQVAGLKAKFTGLTGKRVGVAVESIEGWAAVPVQQGSRGGSFPLSYKLEDVNVLLRIPLLRPWDPGTTFDAQAYDGTISGSLKGLVTAPSLDVEVSNLNLSRHPQLQALGFESGLLSLAVVNHPLHRTPTAASDYQLTINQMTLQLPPAVRDLAKVATIEKGQLSAKLTVQPTGKFALSSCNLTSSLANASLTGRGTLAEMRTLSDFTGSVRVELLGADGARLSQWLPLLTNQRVSASERSFSCTLQVAACDKLSNSDFRVGARCGKATCGS